MKIFNIMLGRNLGGMEQAFVDYSTLIKKSGYNPYNIVSTRCKIKDLIQNENVYKLWNLNQFDIFSLLKLRSLFKKHRPVCIIAHGSRAIVIAKRAALGLNIPLIGVAHNYSIRHLIKSDYIISVSDNLAKFITNNGYSNKKIIVIPNVITIKKEFSPSSNKIFSEENPVIIGAMGRMVDKKGFQTLLEAMYILIKKKTPLKLLLGGEGVEKAKLENFVKKMNLENNVIFLGWVHNKEEFFRNIDIFCLPSNHEPFGIILLEAMAFSKPIVSSATEGPREIIKDNVTGLLYEPFNNPENLASKLLDLINDAELQKALALNAYNTVYKEYGLNNISQLLTKFLKKFSQ